MTPCNLNTDAGRVVYESGDELEQLTANHPVASRCFNCDRDRNLPDTRSDNAGPEPEALEVFKLGSRWARVGLAHLGMLGLHAGLARFAAWRLGLTRSWRSHDPCCNGLTTPAAPDLGSQSPILAHSIPPPLPHTRRTYAAIGLERMGGFVLYDVSHARGGAGAGGGGGHACACVCVRRAAAGGATGVGAPAWWHMQFPILPTPCP